MQGEEVRDKWIVSFTPRLSELVAISRYCLTMLSKLPGLIQCLPVLRASLR